MVEDEFEKKTLITFEQYKKIAVFFEGAETENKLQINYYYDTADEVFRSRNTTCRIRQKENALEGTVKTHFDDEEYSKERSFKIKNLPYSMTVDGLEVYLKGQLVTVRTEYVISEAMVLILDKNFYLGEVDYELELEYKAGYEREAECFIKSLKEKFCDNMTLKKQASKSERFFKKLTGIGVI